jgi:hypothetical protein
MVSVELNGKKCSELSSGEGKQGSHDAYIMMSQNCV